MGTVALITTAVPGCWSERAQMCCFTASSGLAFCRCFMSLAKAPPYEEGKELKMARVLLSTALVALTISAVGALGFLPYSATRDRITDALFLPGALIARLLYPSGVHTGSGAPNWGAVAAWSNVLFYLTLWFVVLWLLRFPRSRAKSA